MASKNTCPIWGTPATAFPTSRDGKDVDSPRAGGRYFVSGTAVSMLPSVDDAIKARLTTWLTEQRRLGSDCPEITNNTIDDANHRTALTVHERGERLLKHMQSSLPQIGQTIKIPPAGQDDAMRTFLAWSESLQTSEVIYLLDYLEKSSWIERGPHESPNGTKEYTITPEGHAYLANLESKAVHSKQAFIAMWFDSSMDDAYRQGIEQGVLEAGYRPIRIDQKDHNNKIDDEIVAEIRRSRFVVADFTHDEAGMRGGVYYEAGFAHGLNIPVIFTCREDVIGKIHFDTRQYNHITWKPQELDQFRKALSDRISATIGDGPLKKNS